MADFRGSQCSVDLSPGTEGSTDLGHRRAKKCERSRRSWSTREEEILLSALSELVAQGWKSDNGFRAGYLNKVEEAIRREFPNSDLKVNPHIISKISTWKKNYYSLQGILSRSGVGFNLRGDHMIECEQEQWDQIVKVDPNILSSRYKSWPYWDSWKDIFGKDRASGSNAEDVMEAVNDLCSKKKNTGIGSSTDVHISFDDLLAHDVAVDSAPTDACDDGVWQGFVERQVPKQRGKKRKEEDGVTQMCELLSRMHDDTSTRLQSLTERIGYEVDISKARKEVFAILGNIHGLSLDEKFDVCDILVKESERLDLFMSLPEDARPAYVGRILRGKHQKID